MHRNIHTHTHTGLTSLPTASGPGKKGLHERPIPINGFVSRAMVIVWDARWEWWRGGRRTEMEVISREC